MLKLQFKDQRKPAIWLVENRYAIGKDAQNNIVLADDGISPFHAELRIEGDQVFISDTGSATGTFVNGKRIQRRTELRASDLIAINKIEFLLIDPKQEAAPTPEGATAISPALANIPVAPSAANKQGTGWVLKAKTGSIVGKSFPVPAVGKLVIGRANNCDIQLPANHVSRQHAEVQLLNGKLLVKDLNSSNGTYINRKKVMDGELKNGDEVRFDTFSFEVAGPAGNTTAQKAIATPADDGEERTQFRTPAVPASAVAPAAAKPAAAPARSSPVATTTVQPKTEETAKSAGGGNTVVIVLLLIVALGVAWFFLK